uniref:Uncharacterized protein n=1 Tax=Tetradesmus obliquus TaxID=3088 RepID=A0A383WBS6_TETOB|eukprot:jgi/Sobl393_1/4490/SZX75068.1
MAARDLANAALVSSDFYKASKHGLAVLEAQAAELKLRCGWDFSKPASVQCSSKTLRMLQNLPRPTGWSWQQWAACLQDPLQFRVYELKQAARQLAVPGNSSKLVISILQAFGLQQPSSVAPQLLRAVLLERCCKCPWAGCEQISTVWEVLKDWSSSEIDRKWPGLSKRLLDDSCSTAAARRRALQMYTGACSKQQLQGLQLLALQTEEYGEWLREVVLEPYAQHGTMLQELAVVMREPQQKMLEVKGQLQQRQQQQEQELVGSALLQLQAMQELADTALQRLQEVAELRDRLQQQLQELPQVVARMVKRHQELSQMSGKQLQGLLEEIGRQPKELRECQQKMDQTLREMISMQQRLNEWVQQVNTNYNFTSIQEAENR